LKLDAVNSSKFFGASDSALMLTLCALQMLVLLLLLLFMSLSTQLNSNLLCPRSL